MSTITSFDLRAFTEAAEHRDATMQLAMYGPDATVTIVDKVSQPGKPRVLSGRDEIRAWLEDTYGREMTHSVREAVSDERRAAFTQACRYPDGTNVLCATVITLDSGLITNQTVIQVWDEEDPHDHALRHETEHTSFGQPDETREFPNGRAEIVSIGDAQVGRMTFQPGWRWSNDVKPIAGTESCLAPHFQYHVSGRLAIRMDDGTEMIAGPGDITSLPEGHDAWVVGDEPAVVVDWYGASNYAKAR
jgi:hypothetical protein